MTVMAIAQPFKMIYKDIDNKSRIISLYESFPKNFNQKKEKKTKEKS